jgi:hypothetical protein
MVLVLRDESRHGLERVFQLEGDPHSHHGMIGYSPERPLTVIYVDEEVDPECIGHVLALGNVVSSCDALVLGNQSWLGVHARDSQQEVMEVVGSHRSDPGRYKDESFRLTLCCSSSYHPPCVPIVSCAGGLG